METQNLIFFPVLVCNFQLFLRKVHGSRSKKYFWNSESNISTPNQVTPYPIQSNTFPFLIKYQKKYDFITRPRSFSENWSRIEKIHFLISYRTFDYVTFLIELIFIMFLGDDEVVTILFQHVTNTPRLLIHVCGWIEIFMIVSIFYKESRGFAGKIGRNWCDFFNFRFL